VRIWINAACETLSDLVREKKDRGVAEVDREWRWTIPGLVKLLNTQEATLRGLSISPRLATFCRLELDQIGRLGPAIVLICKD
jgi:hypothetical protein